MSLQPPKSSYFFFLPFLPFRKVEKKIFVIEEFLSANKIRKVMLVLRLNEYEISGNVTSEHRGIGR